VAAHSRKQLLQPRRQGRRGEFAFSLLFPLQERPGASGQGPDIERSRLQSVGVPLQGRLDLRQFGPQSVSLVGGFLTPQALLQGTFQCLSVK